MKTISFRRIPVLVLLAALAVSAAFNFKLYQLCRTFHLREARVRLDPIGRAEPPTQVAEHHGLTVAVVGDSRARHWAMETCEGIRFLNQGVGNQTTAQVRLRITCGLEEKDVDVYLLQAGINDLKVIPLMPEKREKITRDCVSNLREIAMRLAGSGNPVIIATIFPCGEVPVARRLWWSPDVDAAVVEVNRAILAMDGRDGIRVFDAHKHLAGPDGRARKEYQTDQLHLNARAYRVLNGELLQFLQQP